MDWAEITVNTTTGGAEAVSELLINNGSSGTMIEDKQDLINHDAKADWDYVDDAVYEAYGEEVRVKGYIAKDETIADGIAAVRTALAELKALADTIDGFDVGTLEMTVGNVTEADWANEWKKYYKPSRVSNRVVIVPTWEEYTPEENDVVLEMDPGMAFGTGTHETTRMCLMMLDDTVKEGDFCIDIGCGTAILGIAAAKLGATEVLAIDRDIVAVDSAKTNIVLNKVADKVVAVHGDLLQGQAPEKPAQVIVVNIIADVIIGLVPDLAPFLAENGTIITSGIIKEREQDVVDAMGKAGYTVTRIERMGEWCAVACKR